MEIIKQLFEDILSGKLKGTFVLRGGKKVDSKCLQRIENTCLFQYSGYPYPYPYALIIKNIIKNN